MPAAKRTRTAAAASAPAKRVKAAIDDTARLQFVRSLNTLSATQTKFIESVSELDNFKTTTLKEFDMQLDEKSSRLEELDEEYGFKLKKLQIETKQKFAEFQYETAVDVLKDRNEVPIVEDELAQLNESIVTSRNLMTTQHDELVKRLEADHKKSMNAALQSTTLKHQADIAELTASSTMLNREIKSLHEANDRLHEEIKAQRGLTAEVANASKTGQIQQTFGKHG